LGGCEGCRVQGDEGVEAKWHSTMVGNVHIAVERKMM